MAEATSAPTGRETVMVTGGVSLWSAALIRAAMINAAVHAQYIPPINEIMAKTICFQGSCSSADSTPSEHSITAGVASGKNVAMVMPAVLVAILADTVRGTVIFNFALLQLD